MSTHSVAEAKAQLSALLAEVEAGGRVSITRRGKLVAQLVPATSGASFSWDDVLEFIEAGASPAGRDTSLPEVTVESMRESNLL